VFVDDSIPSFLLLLGQRMTVANGARFAMVQRARKRPPQWAEVIVAQLKSQQRLQSGG
jgi:hypothetical protein